MISDPLGSVRAIGEKCKDGRWLLGSTKTEKRMEGRTPLGLPDSAVSLVEEAIAVPVVAALDRVIILRLLCEFGSADVVTAVPGGGAPIESDCAAAGSSVTSRSSGVDLDDGPNGWDKAGTSVKRREAVEGSSAVEMLEVVLEVLGV